MERRIKSPGILSGAVEPPGDKSISHRAVIFNSIASGKARITNFSSGDDCRSTVACLRALGVDIGERGSALAVSGVGMGGFNEPRDVLNAGNSGTTMRLMAGLLAAHPFLSVITGDESLRSRPMGRLIHPLRMMGAGIWGRQQDSFAPIVIKGNSLRSIEYRLPVASAQLKSAILIAALFAKGVTIIEEPAASRDHTERMLMAMGAMVQRDGSRLSLHPPESLSAIDVRVPGDLSSAAYWLVAAAIHPSARVRVNGTGINPTRSGIIDVLLEMGARLKIINRRLEGGEPVADIEVETSELKGTYIGGALIPRVIDEIPLIAVAATFATGVTSIRNAEELRVKETDRIRSTAEELTRLGARIEELPDGMVIHGVGRLVGAQCHSHDDHRLAMTLGIAALLAEGETLIRNAEVVAVSYPGFWDELARLAR